MNLGKQTFEELWNLRLDEIQNVVIFGKEIPIRRRHDTFGKIYHFNGAPLHEEKPMTEIMKGCTKAYALILEKEKEPNSCLVNWYEDGDDYICFHSDDEKDILTGTDIAIFSFGVTRKM